MSAESEHVPCAEESITKVPLDSSSNATIVPPLETSSKVSNDLQKIQTLPSNLCCELSPVRRCRECNAPACYTCYIGNSEIKNCTELVGYHAQWNDENGNPY